MREGEKREKEGGRERERKNELRVRPCFMFAKVRTPYRDGTPSSQLRERDRGRERVRKRGEGRCRICPELLFSFLKGITGALAPFSYLVFIRLVSVRTLILIEKVTQDIKNKLFTDWFVCWGVYYKTFYGRNCSRIVIS